MYRFATILSASALSAIAFGTDSNAAMPSTTSASGQEIETTITKLAPTAYNLVRLDALKPQDTTLEKFAKVMPNAHEARLVQASVIANPALKRRLEAEHVELDNIVGAERAADGSVTFYLR